MYLYVRSSDNNMINQFRILLLLSGFFLMPAWSYACGTGTDKTEMSCCEQGQTDQSCCEQETVTGAEACCSSQEPGEETCDSRCGGACGQGSCHCPIVHSSFALPVFSFELEHNKSRYFLQKVKFHEKEFYLSSGFYSVWLPPKIG